MALSTTNYGLAAPSCTKTESPLATQQAEDARTLADQALSTVLEQWPVEAGTLQIINYRPSSGTTLLDFEIILPPATWKSDHVLTIVDETETPIPLEWNLQTSNSIYDSLSGAMVADISRNREHLALVLWRGQR